MKIKIIYALVALSISLLTACAGSSTKVVDHWTDPEFNGKLKNILVLSLNQSTDSRRVFENGFLLELTNRKIQAKASYTLLPDYESLDKETVKAAIAGSSIDGVIVLRAVKVTKEGRHVQAQAEGTRYDEFYAYVGEYRPTYDSYTTLDTVVHLDTNLYVVKGEQLVWTGKTETFNPTDVDELIAELAEKVVTQILQTGFL
jgi:hypothetical protein